MELELDQIQKLCKFFHSKVLGLNPVKLTKSTTDGKYQDFETDGYCVSIVDRTYKIGWNTIRTRKLVLTDEPYSTDPKCKNVLSISKSTNESGKINDELIVLDGNKPIIYSNNTSTLYVNKLLTLEKFFENSIMSDITIDYEYFRLAMELKQKFQSEQKRIVLQYRLIDNEKLKRTNL